MLYIEIDKAGGTDNNVDGNGKYALRSYGAYFKRSRPHVRELPQNIPRFFYSHLYAGRACFHSLFSNYYRIMLVINNSTSY